MGRDVSESEACRRALAAAGDAAFEWDIPSDRLTFFNGAAALLGLDEAHCPTTGAELAERIHPDDAQLRDQALAEHASGDRPLDCEYRVRTQAGGFTYVHERGTATCDREGRPVTVNGVLRRIDRRRLRELAAGAMVNYDALSGLYNRVRLRDSLDHCLAQAQREGRRGGFLRIGIDGLSWLNEGYGQAVGDDVIVGVAHRIETCTQLVDVLGRVGGDHFGLIRLPAEADELAALGSRIVEAVRARPLETAAGDIPISVSVGIVLFPDYVKTPFGVFDLAARGLARAKRNGPGSVQVYEPSEAEQREHEDSLAVGARVQRALAEDRLQLAYQPVVSAATGETAFCEALLRLLDDNDAIIRAGHFVPVVEGLGMNRRVDQRALEMAVAALAAHPEASLAINISAYTIDDRSWLRRLASLVRAHPELAQRLIVEITETAVMNDIAESSRHIAAVRDLGCRVALDDFGAGYTSFRELKALEVDMVKIDGQFVRNVAEDAENRLFITTLLKVARSFGMATVAECVETGEDARVLAELGVDYLQGSRYAMPQAALPAGPEAGEPAQAPAAPHESSGS